MQITLIYNGVDLLFLKIKLQPASVVSADLENSEESTYLIKQVQRGKAAKTLEPVH
jgi:hypothetical protein